MDKIKIEIVIIVLAIMIIGGLGIRFDLETDLRARACEVADLEGQLSTEKERVADLRAQLVPPPYAQPVHGGIISSPCGIRKNPFGRNVGGSLESMHRGIDIALPVGAPVYAALAGLVVEHWIPPDGRYYKGHPIMGGMVTIKHEQGLHSLYGHLSASYVREGQWVKRGEKIGEVGNTGYSSGSHLHWEFIIDGFKYLNERVLTRDNK